MIISQVLGAGTPPMLAQAIGGTGANVTALGNSQATAAQLPVANNLITLATASTGVKLPKCESGSEVWLRNDGASPITVYPFEAAGVTIGGAATFGVGVNKTVCFKAMNDTYWASLLSG